MKKITRFHYRSQKWASVIPFLFTMWILCLPFLVFSQETNVYSEGFEATNGGYTKIIEPADPQFPSNTGDGLWMWGTPSWVSAHTGNKCWGTSFSGNMPKSTSSILSPAISLATLTANQSTRVSFWAAVDISMTGASGRFYVSSDGSNFTKLASFFITMAGGWQRYEFDISNYNGGDIYLKFYIIDNGSKRGFYVDDISISAFTKPAVTKILTLEANESSNGSCPWIYTWDGSGYTANNDIYSTARYAGSEYRDYLALAKPLVPENGQYKLQVNEVASDESFTDYIQLNLVDHAEDVKVAPDNYGNMFAYKPANLIPPLSAISNLGINVLDSISKEDGNGFNAYSQDYIDVDFGNVDISSGARMVLKMKGFMDGTGVPRPFTGPPAVVVQSMINGIWTEVGRMRPRFEWDVCVFDVSTFSINPITGVKVRLFSISHDLKYSNIDYVALETGPEPAKTVTIAPFSNATFAGNSVLNQLNTADNQYVNLLPGNHMDLEFIAPPLSAPARSFIFTSEGYYIPRGSTYFIATWSGTAWIIHDAYSFATTDETKTFDLSLFLPDPANEMKVRIWQDYAEGASYPANIDFVGIQQGTTVGTLSTATELTGNTSIKTQVQASDNVYWALHNQTYGRDRWIECKWTGIANNGVPVVSGLNVVSGSTMSWVYTDPENDPQTEASVQVWTGPGGTGTLYWGPSTFTGTGTSVTYAGTPMIYGVTYYLRVKATDGNNWSQWVEYSFVYNIQSPPGIYTTAATAITSTSASSGGEIFNNGGSAVTERGVCWSTSPNPTISDSHSHDGTGSGIFTSSLTSLNGALGVTYYLRAYGTNSVGTGYGPQLSFTYGYPTVTTNAVTDVAPTTATSGGYVMSDGNSVVTVRGVCWNTSGTPTISDSKTTDDNGTGSYTSSITGLTIDTTYFVRAYATNEFGTSYGAERSFTASINFCTPPASGYPCMYMYITDVATTGGTTNFNNTTACAATSYTDYSATIATSQAPGSSVSMNFSSYQYPLGYSVWIDFNDNGIFASNEKVISFYTGGLTASTSFTVPANAPNGSHKMRVRGDYQTAPSDPCAALQYGETEDYTFIVSSSLPANPTSISAASNPICIGSSTQLTANGADGTVYWYTGSCEGSQLTTGNPITVNPDSTTIYYAKNYNNGQFSEGCASATVTVDPVSVGGSINGTDSITYGNSTGTMTLSGHTGTVAKWQKKISTASDWSDISNTTATYSETPSSPGTWQYRAQVKSGSCSETYSGVFSVSVATKTLTIGGSFVPNTKVYDATVASSILTNNLTLVGKVGSDVVSLTAVAVFADKNAGNSKTVSLTGSTITGANASYYTLSLTGAPTASANITAKAINVTAQTDSRIYNGTASSSVAPIVDALQTGDVISTSPTQVYNNKNVGTGKTMTASGLVINDGNSGNNYSVSYVPNATGVITAKAINVTAQTDSRIYNGTASSSVAPIVDALQTGDVISTSPTQVYNNKNVGTGKTMTASGLVINDGNSGNNYSVSYVPNATGVITAKAINVTAQTDSRIYNGTASSSVAPIVDALQTGDVISTSPTQVYNNKNVGTGKTMTASGLVINDGNSGNNYSVSYVPNATGVITAKAINVTAQTDSRIYNGTASSSVAPIVDALQTGDVISTSPTQVYNNKNVGTGKTMTASGLVINDGNSGNNYSVSYVPNTTGVITAKAINVTAQTDSRIYNGTASSSVAPVVDALQTGDAISTSPTQVYNNKNVGTGKTMTASGLVINDGNSGNNYSVSYVPNATGVITAKAINVTAQTDSRIYNGTTSSSVAPVVDALQTGDVVSTSPTQVYNNKNVGTGKTMTASGLVINDGNSGNNYSVSYVPNATGVITAKAINVTAVSDSKIYDDNTSSDGIPTIETAAIQTGDFVSTQPHQVYDTKFVGTGKTMTASGLVLNDGNNGNNYSIRYLTNTTGEIIPGPAHHFSITGPDEVVAGSASSDFTIQVYDQYENATTVTGATTFALTTSSTGTTIIFNPNPVTMANGNGSTTFTYQDSKVGNYTITAARTSGNDAGLVGKSATHNIEVNLTPWQACNTSVSADGVTEYFPDGSISPVYGKFELSATGLSTAQNDVHNFAYQTLGNKGTIIAHAVDIENGGWLGVEMRESCASNAKTVLIKSHIYNPNVIIGYRSNTGKSMSSVSQVTQLTSWLKIQRNGSQFTIYSSNNGTLWQKRYTTTVNMSTNILAGIFTESVRSDRTSIAQFDHVEVSSSLKSSEILDDETIATEQQVDIYPNPADELVNILMPDNESKVKVTLTSMQGNVILTTIFYGSEAQLNTSHINPGVYVLRFETEGNVITKRLVIM